MASSVSSVDLHSYRVLLGVCTERAPLSSSVTCAQSLSVVHGGRDIVNCQCDDARIRAACVVANAACAHMDDRAGKNGKNAQRNLGAKNHAVILPNPDPKCIKNQLVGASAGGETWDMGDHNARTSRVLGLGAGRGIFSSLHHPELRKTAAPSEIPMLVNAQQRRLAATSKRAAPLLGDSQNALSK